VGQNVRQGLVYVDRAQQSEIARQFLDVSKPDVILGGGEDRWLPPGNPGAYPSQSSQTL